MRPERKKGEKENLYNCKSQAKEDTSSEKIKINKLIIKIIIINTDGR